MSHTVSMLLLYTCIGAPIFAFGVYELRLTYNEYGHILQRKGERRALLQKYPRFRMLNRIWNTARILFFVGFMSVPFFIALNR